jgi:type VI protein secretion system component VasK
VTCGKCSSYFCWKCLTILCRTNPYFHFNDPTSSCFDDLFDNPDSDDEENDQVDEFSTSEEDDSDDFDDDDDVAAEEYAPAWDQWDDEVRAMMAQRILRFRR